MSNLPADVEKYTEEYEAKLRSAKMTGSRERPEVVFKRGARFYKDEATGVAMFAFRSSAVNEFIGKANDEHRDQYPTEWMNYVRSLKGKK